MILRYHGSGFGALIGGTEEARHILYDTVAGHHGQPLNEGTRSQSIAVGEDGFVATAELIERIAPLFAPAIRAETEQEPLLQNGPQSPKTPDAGQRGLSGA